MDHHAFDSRCAVDFRNLKLPVSRSDALGILLRAGFRVAREDIISLARSCIGKSGYKRGARLKESPGIVDCSSFTQWLYGRCGIEIPRRTIQQHGSGQSLAPGSYIRKGDLIFTAGTRNYYLDNPSRGVGHVAIATGTGTVIHAVNKCKGVKESNIEPLIYGSDKFRGIRRIVDDWDELIVLETPEDRDVRTSDDIRWIVLQNLTRGNEYIFFT